MRELRGWDSVESYGKAGTLCGEDRRLAELGAEQNREPQRQPGAILL